MTLHVSHKPIYLWIFIGSPRGRVRCCRSNLGLTAHQQLGVKKPLPNRGTLSLFHYGQSTEKSLFFPSAPRKRLSLWGSLPSLASPLPSFYHSLACRHPPQPSAPSDPQWRPHSWRSTLGQRGHKSAVVAVRSRLAWCFWAALE